MRVVIIGPGRIGCGYLAPVFREAGWEVILAARNTAAVSRIRRAGGFDIRVTGATPSVKTFTGDEAVAVGEGEFDEAIAHSDLVCTAVGVSNVSTLASPLARALSGRLGAPLDVWVVENADCAALLARGVRAQAGNPLAEIGFAGAVATAVVARGGWGDSSRPVFVGDMPRRLYVDQRPLKSQVTLPNGVELTDSYLARLAEKLYGFNSAHAICAYLGWLRGHRTIDQAVADPFLRPMVAGCLLESSRALAAAYPQLGLDPEEAAAEAMRRFSNVELADPISRVAREPNRKLAAGDRLLGAVALIRATRRLPSYFSLAIASALLYRHPDDVAALELGERLTRQGLRSVLRELCGLEDGDHFADAVERHYRSFVFTDDETLFPPVYDGLVLAQGVD